MITIRRTKNPDMSPEAVAARLEDLASLYELGMSLRDARVVGPAESSGGVGLRAPEAAPARHQND